MFSFLNPSHERRVKEIIEEELPDVFISLSSDISPQIREYERTTITVINAYVTPIVSTYLEYLKNNLEEFGWNKPINIMMNSGGLSDVPTMNKISAKSLLSGPACYNMGGEKPTITDVLLLLGLIDETNFLAGKLELSKDNSRKAILEYVAKPLDISVKDACVIIYRVVCELMADSLRLITMQRGNDPRKYSLVSSGGDSDYLHVILWIR